MADITFHNHGKTATLIARSNRGAEFLDKTVQADFKYEAVLERSEARYYKALAIAEGLRVR